MRLCRICNNRFPATTEYFYKDTRYKDGITRQCKTCVIARSMERHKRLIENRLDEKEVAKPHEMGVDISDVYVKIGQAFNVTNHFGRQYFRGVVKYVNDLHFTLINKVGVMETFLKVDLLINDYNFKEV